jgi:hypothetical protein
LVDQLSNGLGWHVGLKVTLEKWKVVDNFIEIFGVNFELGWRAVRP